MVTKKQGAFRPVQKCSRLIWDNYSDACVGHMGLRGKHDDTKAHKGRRGSGWSMSLAMSAERRAVQARELCVFNSRN